ncbi:MAG: SprB repeat-containing protein [Saprospiraceae bacterium]|nr:SprB repeat-containing protein [Saprospiraceae bacterium]
MSKNIFLLFICTFLLSAPVFSGGDPYKVTDTRLIKLGKTKSIQTLLTHESPGSFAKSIRKINKKRPDNFKGREYRNILSPEKEHQGPDPIRQHEPGTVQNDPIINIDGIFSVFGSPHDPTGDVGTTHYVQAINATEIGVFDLTGTLLEKFASNILWTEFGRSGAGDPIILYDETENRWMITEFDDPALVLIAISDNEDPLGSYTAYEFATPTFPDYPKYAIWPNSIVFTTNEEGPGVLHNYFIQKDSLYAGADEVIMQRIEITGSENTEAGFFVTTPVDFAGKIMPADTRPMVMRLNDSSWGEVSEDMLELYLFNINWENQNATSITQVSLVTTPYDGYPCSSEGVGFACVPQLNGNGLDAIPEVIMNVPMFRSFGTYESLVLSFVTDVTNGENQSGIRWMELRKNPGSEWFIFQEGTYAPDGLDRFMSSIAIDKNGNIGMGYNVSSKNSYVGVRYTGRFLSDPPGLMTIEEVNVVDGSTHIESFGRFGDYAQMGIDPIDELTFWYTTEYAGGIENSKTRIVAFQLQKNQVDIRPVTIQNPVTGHNLTNNETITANILNAGLRDVFDIQMDLFINGVKRETLIVGDTMKEGQVKVVNFAAAYDFAAFGPYDIMIVTTLMDDENIKNDTLRMTVYHYAVLDGKIDEITKASFCDSDYSIPFSLQNVGLQNMTSAEIELNVNGQTVDTLIFMLNLAPKQTVSLSYPVTGLSDGDNEVGLILTKTNNESEENITDNIASTILNYDTQSVLYKLIINTDEYPEETTWFITSENNSSDIIASGGPYFTALEPINIDLCLQRETCYTFTILDELEDGICCDFGEGSIEMYDASNNLVFENDGAFFDISTNDFCVESGCALVLTFNNTPASSANSNDGKIIINVSGGQEPYLYSINGGSAFQDSFLFENLLPGLYEIVVKTADGNCITEASVVLDFQSSVSDSYQKNSIQINPNPGSGFYHINMSDTELTEYQIPAVLLDAQGKEIQKFIIQKYGNTFHRDISILAYPKGIYYIVLHTSKGKKYAAIIYQ